MRDPVLTAVELPVYVPVCVEGDTVVVNGVIAVEQLEIITSDSGVEVHSENARIYIPCADKSQPLASRGSIVEPFS